MNKAPYVIGITGTIGSGKSTVGSILEKQDIPVIDSDKIVHDLFKHDIELKKAIQERFGDGVIQSIGDEEQIDRVALGKIVFGDADARKDLEAIVHPATIEACRRAVEKEAAKGIVAVLVPLLFEANLEKHYDEIWAVHVDPDILKKRIQWRDRLSIEDVEKRIQAQLPQQEKMARAKALINNSGTQEETEAQVLSLLQALKARL